MLHNKDRLMNFYIFLVDSLVLFGSYWLGQLMYLIIYGHISNNALVTPVIFLFSLMVTLLAFSPYKSFMRRTKMLELWSILKMTLVWLLILVFLIYIVHLTDEFSRLVTFFTLLFFVLFDFLIRELLKYIFSKSEGSHNNEVILVTLQSQVEETVKNIHEVTGYKRIHGIVLMDVSKIGTKICGIPVVSDQENVQEYMRREIVDEVIINIPEESEFDENGLIREMTSMGIVVNVILHSFDAMGDYLCTPLVIGPYSLLSFSVGTVDYGKLVIKRILDIFLGVIGSCLTLIAMIFIAPAIKLTSPGPIFFTQKRVGRNGRYFKIFKFRTMYQDAEERKKELMHQNEMKGQMFKMEDDPRITKVGKFLRKTSLDELPQFFNILKGDMSMVGTRPPTVSEFSEYADHHKRRLSMKPGLTGLWQVSGRSEIKDFEEIVMLDCYYIDHWSLSYDIKIFLKTFLVVLKQKGSE